jgi:hypothetical protein
VSKISEILALHRIDVIDAKQLPDAYERLKAIAKADITAETAINNHILEMLEKKIDTPIHGVAIYEVADKEEGKS